MTSYLRLIDRFPLRPLRSDEELDRAVALVDELLDRRDLDPGEQDYLDTLALLVERYENEAHPIEPPSDGEMLGHLLEARGVNQAEAARGAGIAASTINEVLAGKRKLNRRHIGKLAAYFEVDPGVFAFRGD
jgi:HTH-type transcriptional regulator/antitoxin HigA